MNESFDLFCAYYTKTYQHPIIVLKARDASGARRTFFVENFKPYFYVLATGTDQADGVTTDGRPVTRINVKMPGDVKLQRELYPECFESDIPFPQRFLIDSGIYCGFEKKGDKFVGTETLNVKPRILYLDIEVEALEGVPDSRRAKEPMYVIGCIDSYSNELKQFVPASTEPTDQAELLRNFFTYVKERDFDLIVGWNPFYDVDYLISKAEQLHVRYDDSFGYVTRGQRWIDIDGRELFDLLAAYRKFFQQTKFDAYSLDFIYEKDFDEPFLEYDYNTTDFSEIELIKKANAFHVTACQKIDEKWNLVDWADQIRRICGCTYRQALTTIYFTDLAWLRRAHGRIVSPERLKERTDSLEFEGGMVLEPKKGVFHNVCVLDFKKMYPSIMIALNMSPETVSTKPIENAFEIDGVYFKKEPVGILPGMLIDFIGARNRIKEQLKHVDSKSEEYQVLYAHQYALKQNVDACLPGYTKVLTPTGVTTVEELEVGDRILTPSGFKNVVSKSFAGKKQVCEIKTNDNFTLHCTTDHKVCVRSIVNDSKTNEEVEAAQLRETHYCKTLRNKRERRSFLSKFKSRTLLDEQNVFDIGIDSDEHVFYAGTTGFFLVHNSYGVFAEPAFRMYTPLIPKSTTFMGRKFITLAKEIVESYGYSVIAGDTDALMFEGGPNFLEVGKQMEHAVNSTFQQQRDELGFKYPIEVEFELAYESILFKQRTSASKRKQEHVAKKRYAGIVVYEGNQPVNYLKVRGFEVRRSDSALITRQVQNELFRLILGGASWTTIREFLKQQVESLTQLPLKQIGIPRRLNMRPEDYKNPATIRSILFSNEYLGEQIKPGQRCYDVMVKRIKIPSPDGRGEIPQSVRIGEKMYPIDRAALTEKIPDGIEVDWNAQIEKILKQKLEPILKAVGYEWEQVFSDKRNSTLGQFGIS